MRRPWRRWSAKQLLVFLVETLVLSMAIVLLGVGGGLPAVIQVVASIVGWILLLVGVLIALGWVCARRRSS